MGAEHQVAPSPWTVEPIDRADLARRLTLRAVVDAHLAVLGWATSIDVAAGWSA